MSSVISHEKCPRCGGVLSIEFDCRTYEEWKGCSRCGRRDGWHYIRDEEGNAVLCTRRICAMGAGSTCV